MMRASVTDDRATRVIELKLEPDGPAWDLHDLTATWRDKPRVFRPDLVRLVLVQAPPVMSGEITWEASTIRLSGQLVLKSGAVSTAQQSRDSMVWRRAAMKAGERIDHAPEWVREIVAQAPHGITGYLWTDSERAEEVRAL